MKDRPPAVSARPFSPSRRTAHRPVVRAASARGRGDRPAGGSASANLPVHYGGINAWSDLVRIRLPSLAARPHRPRSGRHSRMCRARRASQLSSLIRTVTALGGPSQYTAPRGCAPSPDGNTLEGGLIGGNTANAVSYVRTKYAFERSRA